jgi:hypothetical protein
MTTSSKDTKKKGDALHPLLREPVIQVETGLSMNELRMKQR